MHQNKFCLNFSLTNFALNLSADKCPIILVFTVLIVFLDIQHLTDSKVGWRKEFGTKNASK